MDELLIGLDLGTTVLKAAACERQSGRSVASAAVRLPVRVDADGGREQDPAKLQAALPRVFAELRRQLGPRWGAVTGIGLAAQGGSAAMVNRHTGRALTPMSLWNDARVYAWLPKITALRPPEYWRALHWRDEPSAGLARLLWWQEKYPDCFGPEHLYSGAGDFLYFQLTGEWRQDAGNACQEGCYEVAGARLVAEPLNLVGQSLDRVSPLRQGHATAPLRADTARRLGLPAGLPVAGPYMDHEAGYLAAAGVLPRPLQVSLGTAWVGNVVFRPQDRWQSPFQLVLSAPVGAGWLQVQPLLTGNVTWDWALATLVGGGRRRTFRESAAILAEQLLPPAGLVFLPWMNRPNPWSDGELGGGAFLGLHPGHTRADMLRAVALAMVAEFHRVEGALGQGLVDGLVLAGGASKSPAIQQLFAALWAPLPVVLQPDEDFAGARGALHVFRRDAKPAVATPITVPPAEQVARLRAAADRYVTQVARHYGHVPVGAALTVPARP